MDSRTSSTMTPKNKRAMVLRLLAILLVLLFIIHNLFGGIFKSWSSVYEDCFIKRIVMYIKTNNSLITPFFEYSKIFTCESE